MTRRVVLAALLLMAPLAEAEASPRIAIVRSQDLDPYAQAVTAFSLEARGELVEYALKGDDARAKKAFESMRARPPALVWALGPLAATTARRELPDVPLLFAFVPNHEKYELLGPNVTGVALTRSARAQIETLKALAPATKAVGVVFDPRSSAVAVEQSRRAAQDSGLVLVAAPANDPSKVDAALATLAGKVEAIWLMPDRTLATVEAFDQIIVFAKAKRLPVFALSEEQVRAGALVSLAPDVASIGRQAAKIANRIVHEGVAPKALPVVDPEGLELAINLTTARSLGSTCDLALDIFAFAAKRSYPIRVHE